MKRLICLVLMVLAITAHAKAADIPKDLSDALPEGAEELLKDTDFSDTGGFTGGVSRILGKIGGQVQDILHQRVQGAASVLLVVVLCGAVEGFYQGTREKPMPFLPMVGALSVTLVTAGSLDTLIGLGSSTM